MHQLVIELDGDGHGGNETYDTKRTAWLEQQGSTVIRFSTADGMGNIEGALQAIASELATALCPTRSPEGRGLKP